MNANLAQSRGNPVHFHTQNYPAQSRARIPKGKNGLETIEKQLKMAKNRAKKARKSFKNQENIKRKREAGNSLQKQELFNQNGRVGISAVYFKDNFSHNIA